MHRFTFTLMTGFLLCCFTTQVYAWGWKKATDPTDVINFLNSKPPYTQKIKAAEITAVNKGHYIEFTVFYLSGKPMATPDGWGWKKATSPNDVNDFISGNKAYKKAVKKAKVVAVEKKTHTEYYIFYKRR